MGRLLLGIAGVLFVTAPFAAAASAAGHGGWVPVLGALALGGLLGSLFGANGFAAAFVLTLLVVVAAIVLAVLGKARPGAATPPVAAAPPGFDSAQFLRSAKLAFVKLQAARELGAPERLRELATAEVCERLRAEHLRPGPEVLELNAELLEAVGDANRQRASVRFSGMARPAPGAVPVGFVQVWDLAKPGDGASGWRLAGIRQMR